MIQSKKTWFGLTSIAVIASITVLSAGCDFGPSTSYYDYLIATGTVYQADSRTPIPGITVDNYDWIVTYTDGSTVAVPFALGLTTDVNGQFKFDSSKLSLQSGNLAESCTDVCVGTSTSYEEYCSGYSTDYGSEYCSSWQTDSEGDEYCASWETDSTTYCSSWDTRSYETCTSWGQDCEYYYPARDIGDIYEAYAEITYNLGGSTLVTQSSNTNYPDPAIQQVSTTNPESKDVTVDTIWNEIDSFTTPISFATRTLTANQAKITAERNAVSIAARKMTQPLPAGVKAPRTRLTRKEALKIPFAQLSIEQQLKVEAARNGCGAVQKD